MMETSSVYGKRINANRFNSASDAWYCFVTSFGGDATTHDKMPLVDYSFLEWLFAEWPEMPVTSGAHGEGG